MAAGRYWSARSRAEARDPIPHGNPISKNAQQPYATPTGPPTRSKFGRRVAVPSHSGDTRTLGKVPPGPEAMTRRTRRGPQLPEISTRSEDSRAARVYQSRSTLCMQLPAAARAEPPRRNGRAPPTGTSPTRGSTSDASVHARAWVRRLRGFIFRRRSAAPLGNAPSAEKLATSDPSARQPPKRFFA